MAKLLKIFKFSAKELLLLVEAWVVFLKWDLLISFTQYEKWRNKIHCLSNLRKPSLNDAEKSANTAITPEQITLIIRLSEISGRFHFRKMNCLRRCVSQQEILVKRSIDTRMHIGIRIEEEKVKAHAWLTLNGRVINDSEEVISLYSELKSANEHNALSTLK